MLPILSYHLDLTVPEAEAAVRAALQPAGFGILTEIDVQATFKAKLDIDRPPYRILGACNPALANRALELAPDAGAFLPCGIALYPEAGGTRIAIQDPMLMASQLGFPALEPVAIEARDRIATAIESIAAPTPV